MARGKSIIVLTYLFIVLPFALNAQCPSEEDLAPCYCLKFGNLVEITCNKIDNEVLARVASSLKGDRNVNLFTIRDSKLGSIPRDVFKGVKLSKIEIRTSTLAALTDRDEAFAGLEDHLETLNIYRCVLKNEWDWSVLRNLKKLKRLLIWDSLHLEKIGTDVMKASVPSLEFISLDGNNISIVSDHAFHSYKNLEVLTLFNNKIKTLKRTMLPNPALKLTSLSFSSNLIEQFPADMFTSMPNLNSLGIGFNKILVLDEKTFSPVWEQLNIFSASGNELLCDCSMSWLLEKRTLYYLTGECASPLELKGKKLGKLMANDFKCHQ